jgi:hypothetical protein
LIATCPDAVVVAVVDGVDELLEGGADDVESVDDAVASCELLELLELVDELDVSEVELVVVVVGGAVVVVVVVVVVAAGSTTIVPCIELWILQWYGNVPAVLNVWDTGASGFRQSSVWLSFVHVGLVSNEPSSAVAVWATSSLFVHWTESPTFTVTVAGLNAKFWTRTPCVETA